MKNLGPLNEQELKMFHKADSIPTDAERQAAYQKLDYVVRNRLKVPPNRYWGFRKWPDVGNVILDEKRSRPIPVTKISKSDQSPNDGN